MMGDISENLEFAGIVSVIIAGVNTIWGILLLPFYMVIGALGISFAIINLFSFFYAMKTKKMYEERDYESARDNAKYLMLFGFLFGLVVLGIPFYFAYKNLDEIITKKYLVKAPEEPFYPPPQFPS